ncbi:MAG: dTDP-4-dehydrorhamnose 3,5-epimerase family protein, partial [Dehalobacterium sp.]
MKFIETELDGVIILEPDVFGDNRGWFMESWSDKWLENMNCSKGFVQDNHSYSAYKGTVRGMHFQKAPMAQAKLIRCISGSIMD